MNHMRMLAALLMCMPLFVNALPANAHGTGQHIMGTVTAISETRLEVRTQKGQNLSVQLTDKTEFRARGKETAGAKPQVGDRVVIDATGKGEDLTATEVLFATAPGKTKGAK